MLHLRPWSRTDRRGSVCSNPSTFAPCPRRTARPSAPASPLSTSGWCRPCTMSRCFPRATTPRQYESSTASWPAVSAGAKTPRPGRDPTPPHRSHQRRHPPHSGTQLRAVEGPPGPPAGCRASRGSTATAPTGVRPRAAHRRSRPAARRPIRERQRGHRSDGCAATVGVQRPGGVARGTPHHRTTGAVTHSDTRSRRRKSRAPASQHRAQFRSAASGGTPRVDHPVERSGHARG